MTIWSQNIDFYENVNFETNYFSKNGPDAGLDRSKDYASPGDRIPMEKNQFNMIPVAVVDELLGNQVRVDVNRSSLSSINELASCRQGDRKKKGRR